VVAVAGLAVRVAVLASSLGDLDSDEAIVGLMARRLLDGAFDTFYIGQAYGGSQEAVLASAVFVVTGSSVLGLKAVMVALTALTALLTWRVGRRVVGEHAAVLAAAVVWLGPPFAVLWSTKARSFYGMSSTMALLAILAALRLLERPSRADAALLGVAVGMGWWANPQTAAVVGPAVLCALALRPSLLRLSPVAVPAALVGAGPWLLFNLRNRWESLHTPPVPIETTFPERFADFFTEALPRYLGLTDQLSGAWRWGGLSLLLYLALAAAAVAWLVAAVRARDRRTVLAAPLVAFPVYFGVNPFTAYPEPRYVWVIAPVLLLALADVAVRLAARVGRPAAAFALVPLVAVGSVLGLVDLTRDVDQGGGNWDLVAGDADPLADALLARGYTHAYAEYWIAYKLSFESDERLIATGVPHRRGVADEAAVNADPRPAYVTLAGDPVAERVRAGLAAAGVPAERIVVGIWEAQLPLADLPFELRTSLYRP
jgi:hypothetical protein